MTVARAAIRLPAGLLPRGLGREEAARYLGIAPTTLDKEVDAGRIIAPRVIGGRRVWDRLALDRLFDDASPSVDDGEALRRTRAWREGRLRA